MRLGKMLKEVIESLFKKPITVSYPIAPEKMPKGYRGKLKFFPEKCIGCKLCMKDCPSNAITINKTADGKYEAIVDLSKCIYCGQCVDSCAKKALEITDEFELAQIGNKELTINIDANKSKGS